ncbi:imidazole glycerol phosphate synthase subunit HisH [bacterium]|nr:imidazole glycerol phosphate synthase subunit HisH [bacterium]
MSLQQPTNTPPRVAIVRTGLANLASVLAGLRRAGADPYVTESAADVEREDHVMLPGVGAFGPAMEMLDKHAITAPLKARIEAGRSTLCICLGQQLLARTSDESPGATGLSIVDRHVQRLPASVRVPHFGWNLVEPPPGARLITKGHAYFANSFCIAEPPEGWHAATTQHGIRFVAAMERGNVLTCQFHPELSGKWGLALLKRWLGTDQCEDDCEC